MRLFDASGRPQGAPPGPTLLPPWPLLLSAEYEKGNYSIRSTVELRGNIDNGKGHGSADTEITAGGPGNCCGLTIGVHNDTGYIYSATEDWTDSPKEKYPRSDSPKDQRSEHVGPCTQ